jgi:hypothetical protein
MHPSSLKTANIKLNKPHILHLQHAHDARSPLGIIKHGIIRTNAKSDLLRPPEAASYKMRT